MRARERESERARERASEGASGPGGARPAQDGADELLAGYSFTWGGEDPDWSARRANLAARMAFSTHAVAASLGLACESPFLDAQTIAWALALPKAACVAERPIELAPAPAGAAREMHTTGKARARFPPLPPSLFPRPP